MQDPTTSYNNIKARIEELCSGLCKSTLDTVDKAMRNGKMKKATITDVPMGPKACDTGAALNDVPMGTNYVQERIKVLCSGLYKSALDTVEKAMKDGEKNKAAITDIPMGTNQVQARPRLQALSLSDPSTKPG